MTSASTVAHEEGAKCTVRCAGGSEHLFTCISELELKRCECELDGPRSIRRNASQDKHVAQGNRPGTEYGPTRRLSGAARGASLPSRSADDQRGGGPWRPTPDADPRHLLRGMASRREAAQDTLARRIPHRDNYAHRDETINR